MAVVVHAEEVVAVMMATLTPAEAWEGDTPPAEAPMEATGAGAEVDTRTGVAPTWEAPTGPTWEAPETTVG